MLFQTIKGYNFPPTYLIVNANVKNEYRQTNKNSEFIADFNLTKGYKSNLSNEKIV